MEVSKHLILTDLHIPAHNKAFTTAVLKYLYMNRKSIDSVNYLGDIMDAKAVSFHDKGKVLDIDLGTEYDVGNVVLDLFDEAAGGHDMKTRFLFGNHEDRLFRDMQQHDVARYGDALISMDAGLNLYERGYEVFHDWKEDEILLGDLYLIHGLWTNIHTAYQHAMKMGKNIMFGHTHRVQTYNLGEQRPTAYNIGWMGDPNHRYLKYMPKAQRDAWQNAFAIVTVVDGISHVQLVEWKNNCFVVDGVVYK